MAHAMNYAKAASYSRHQLLSIGGDSDTPLEWCIAWIPEGQLNHAEVDSLVAMDSTSDERMVRSVRLLQRFVYGDSGDVAAGVPAQPATDDEADGYFGPSTLRRVYAWEAFRAGGAESIEQREWCEYITMNGEQIAVPGVRVVHPHHRGGLSFEREYKRRGGGRPFLPWSREWKPESVRVPYGCSLNTGAHWDACMSASQCFSVLFGKRGSSTFGIDSPGRDGHVYAYQWLDPGLNRGYHGKSPANNKFLHSHDLNSAYYPKYRDHYTKQCGIVRPLITGTAHGKRRHFLGMYRDQILASLRISKALAERFPRDLSYAYPATPDGLPVTGLWRDRLFDGNHNGCATHLHWGLDKKGKPNKKDVCAFEDQIIYLMRKDSRVAHEFPVLAELFRVADCRWNTWEAERDSAWDWPEVQEM